MTIKIGSNLASLQAQRRLGDATSALSTIYERLTSGKRINRAADDAAGLAIADDLNSRTRVFTQAIRNGNDGLSLLSITDSANKTLAEIITRIRELTEQSANGTYSNKQRDALDSEAQALKNEFLRIAQTTSFNGVKVFDGSLGGGLRLQLGYGTEGSINASIGGAIGTGTFGNSTTFATEGRISNALALGDLNNDGILDLVTAGSTTTNGFATVRLGTGSGSFGTATSFSTEERASLALALGDLNGDGILDLVTAGQDNANNGFATVRLGTGNGSFGIAISFSMEGNPSRGLALGDINGDGNLDIVTAGSNDSNTGTATIRLGLGDGNFGTASSFATEDSLSYAVALRDLNGDGILDLVTAGRNISFLGIATVRLGTGNGSFGSAVSYSTEGNRSLATNLGDLNRDGIMDLVTTGFDDSNDGFSTVRLGLGNGSFGSATSYTAESNHSRALSLGDINGDGFFDLVTTGYNDSSSSITTIRMGSGSGSFGIATSISAQQGGGSAVALEDLNGDGVLDVITAGANSVLTGSATVRLGNFQDGLGAMLEFSLKTRTSALQAMAMLDRTLANLAKQRGVIGASQSRIAIALEGLASSREKFSAAESRIRDADVAAESASLIRTQILQQAASSVLGQANQAPSLALTLLR